jgi:CubicO group peptidase (beta-lactamase class C family)
MFHPCADFNVTFTELKDAEHSAGVIPDVEARLDAFMSDNNVLGCALGIVKNGEIHYLTAKGTSRLPLFDNDVPNDDPLPFTIGTPSSIGSISKTLTALGILKLVERGYIDLDRAALHYVPNLLGAAIWLWDPAVTVRQLLSHTSGLARSPVWNYPYLEVQLEEVFGDTFGDHPGIHPYPTYFGYLETPAVGFDGQSTARYSNVGYCILGAIIDYITRTKPGFSEKEIGYENFIWWNIGLRGCACTLTDSMWSMCLRTWWRRFDILNLAWDYNFDAAGNATVGVADTHSPGWEGPAGGWAMTIGDLTRLMIMIAHNEIISSDLKEEMMEPLGIDYSLSFL